MALPVLRHEDPGVVGMAAEGHPQQVPGLAFHGLRPGVQVEERRHLRIGLRHLGAEPDASTGGMGEQAGDDLEPFRSDALGQVGPARVGRVVHDRQVNGHHIAVVTTGGHRLVPAVHWWVQDHLAEGLGHRDAPGGRTSRFRCGVIRRGGLHVCSTRRRIAHREPSSTGCSPWTSGTCSWMPAPPLDSVRRRVSSPFWMLSCNVRMACMRVSGPGGQPGA